MRRFLVVLALACTLSSATSAQVRSAAVHEDWSGVVHAAQQAALSRLQHAGTNVSITWNHANATPAFLAGRLSPAGYKNTFPSPQDAALAYINENRALFLLTDPTAELRPLKVENDNIGMTHVRLQQTFHDLRVVGAQLVVHFARDGSVSSVNGRYSPIPRTAVIPGISAQQALSVAAAAAKAPAASQELVIYLKDYTPLLAYEVHLPTPMAPHQKVTVDAQSGAVLDLDDGIRYDGPDVGSGLGVFGETRSLNIYLSGGTYYLIDASKPMYTAPIDSMKGVVNTYDAHNDTSDSNPYHQATLVYDPNGDKLFNDSARFAAAVDAHYFTGKVYDYYKTHFNRNSWNNAGGTLTNAVHYLYKYNNAFWNGSFMSYGDGDGVEFANLAGGFDVIVHEITHGVTESTANLEYRGQSGALNESYSDVMACMADSTNWTIGEDVYTPGTPGDALRSLSDPHQGATGIADPRWQPAVMGEYLYMPYTNDNDHGGVHTNSGVPNHAAYYVGTSIGHGRTEQIYYRTLVYYLTPKSVFVDARILSLQAAADLYGSGGVEYAAVATAFDNVGITADLPRTNELAYDNGSPTSNVFETDANWGLVNRLSPSGSGKLITMEFLYKGDNNPSGNGSFVLKVFADGGGKPGNNLFTSAPVTPGSSAIGDWFTVDVQSQNINVNGDFYVGLFYDGVNQPLIAADTIPNDRAWEWDNTQSKWTLLDQNSYFPITLFIRGIVSTATGVHTAANDSPVKYSLLQNYPNPFNPSTTIQYALPQRAQVRLTVYNTLGQEVAQLVNGEMEAGYHSVRFDADRFASGVYFYRLSAVPVAGQDGQAGSYVETKKFLLIR